MDLNNFNFKETEAQKVELTNPATEEPLLGDDGHPVWISVFGSDSAPFRQATRAYGNKKMAKGGRAKTTIEEIESIACKILATCTESWSDNFEVRGEVLECNQENAEMVYREFTWVREQVDAFVNERANFLKKA